MAFQNWSSLHRLDAVAPHDSDVSLYHGNQLVLTVGKGVTFGFLKLLYNAELNNRCGNLVGLKVRGDSSQKVISSDDAFLDKDEYELIIQDYIISVTKPGNAESVMPIFTARHIQTIQQCLSQSQFNATLNQRFLPLLPISLYPLPNVSSCNEPVTSTLQQSPLTFSNTTTSTAPQVPFVTELPQVSNMQTETYAAPEPEQNLQEAVKVREIQEGESDSICKMSVDNQANVSQERCLKISDETKDVHGDNCKDIKESFTGTGKFPHQCEVCHIPFKSKTKLDYHKRRHTEENPHMCVYCGEAFKFYIDLSKHRDEQHLCNKTFKCEQCTKSFSSRKELERHLWRHTGKKSHKCELCGKEYTSAGNLSLHRQKHTGLKPLKCSLCPKTFRHKTVLENHIRMSHTGERPFACAHCEKTFPTKSQLSSHEKRHSDLKPYKCTECGKAFRQGHILKRHSLVHTNERPYKCHVCPKSFRELSNLQYHQRTHFDKSRRSVVCPLCGKNIVTGRGIKRHLKLYHNRICANENDARILLKSLHPVENSSEETAQEQSANSSVNRNVSGKHINSVKAPPLCLNEGIQNDGVPPTRSCDTSQNGNLPSTEKNIAPCEVLKDGTLSVNTGTRRTTRENVNVAKAGSNRKNDTKKAKFRCSICSRAFRGPKTFTNHMKIAHGDCKVLVVNSLPRPNDLKCKDCYLYFADKGSLKSHTDKVHLGFDARSEDLSQEDNVQDVLTKNTEEQINLIEENSLRNDSLRAKAGCKVEEVVRGQSSEREETEPNVSNGNMTVRVSFKEGTYPCSKHNDQSLASRSDGVKEINSVKQGTSHFDLPKAENLQSNLLNTNSSDRIVTGLLDINLSRADLLQPKIAQSCGNNELCRSIASVTGRDGDLTEKDHHNEKNADCKVQGVSPKLSYQDDLSFQVVSSCISKEQEKLCIVANEVGKKSSSFDIFNENLKPTLSGPAENSSSKEKNSNVMEQIITSRFEGNLIHVLENHGNKHLTEIPKCTFKGVRLPVIRHDVLENEPPLGYSFGFLPILVANGYLGRN